jgi:hypothetical protein
MAARALWPSCCNDWAALSARIRAACSRSGQLPLRSALWGGAKFPDAALGGSIGLYGSPSKAVSDALRNEFDNPFLEPLVAVAASPALTIDSQAFLDWNREAARVLRALPEVREVADYPDSRDAQLRSATRATKQSC